jgi:glyoxylase-like metal-dependent hydrolase (beta-lactamase superfamily II)
VHRIRLGNTVFEGRNIAYVLDAETTTLIDTGINTPEVEEDLRAGLSELGLALADVEEVLLTHWHPDHAGLAGMVQAESGATIRVHEADAPLVAGNPDKLKGIDEIRRRSFEEWGIPVTKRDELSESLILDELSGNGADVTPFIDGETFALGDITLEAVHLPGHAAGLCAFAFEGESGSEAFVGDAILPKYTPNVGGADLRVNFPLKTYIESLLRMIERDFVRGWPGHRDPIDDPSARAARIIEHHRERTERVVTVLREHGPCDVWTVSANLFGELHDIHILHGPGEAYAHLDHLRHHDLVERAGTDYRLVDPASDQDVDALFPTLSVEPASEA